MLPLSRCQGALSAHAALCSGTGVLGLLLTVCWGFMDGPQHYKQEPVRGMRGAEGLGSNPPSYGIYIGIHTPIETAPLSPSLYIPRSTCVETPAFPSDETGGGGGRERSSRSGGEDSGDQWLTRGVVAARGWSWTCPARFRKRICSARATCR